jgi:mono/diheme cytochrome c family protein
MNRSLVGAGAPLVLAILVVLSFRGAASPEAGRQVQSGRALYLRQCVACHGESGRGDGPSATAFATKPADLTDGRLMNALPDDFLANVILDGGPAEGLAPTMPPFRGHLGAEQTADVIAYLRSIAQPPFRPDQLLPAVDVAGAPVQPIFFSHLIHAGSFQIPCQHCHADARRSDYAGLPSVERCMGCHKIIGAQDNPEIRKIHDYWERRAPIPWVRVFKVPEFTVFPHNAHVRAGVTCQTCHGPIERMRVVGATTGPNLVNDLLNVVGIRPAAPPLTMGWCVECHRQQNAAKGLRAPLDCMACHH